MPTFDVNGLPLTLEDHRAGAAWDRMVSGFMAHSASTPEHLSEVLRRAPEFILMNRPVASNNAILHMA